jgi:hypothetical protein
MGHATIIGQDVPAMLEKASLIKNTFAIIGNEPYNKSKCL